jgi:uncharacterized repeat protein (TIGR03803 family)
MFFFKRAHCFALLLAALFFNPAPASAQTFSVLHNFAATPTDGQLPYSTLLASGSTLYGLTTGGGASSDGTLFSYNTTNNAYQSLYSFAGGTTDGEYPVGSMTLSGNLLYGSTTGGGASATSTSGNGTLFSYNLSTNTESLAYSFPGGNGGSTPDDAPLPVNGLLYGTTNDGGTANGGTIFSFNPSNNNVSILHSFAGGSSDGYYARYGNFVGAGPVIYGVTSDGGQDNDGAVYSFNTQTNQLTVLHAFDNTDGYYPEAGLTLSGQMLYGTTGSGGLGYGVIYSYNLATSQFSLLYQFDGSQGQFPTGQLLVSGSQLYGMTEYGGPDNDGTIFSFNTSTDDFTTIHNFDNADGSGPWQNNLLLMNNTLYGNASSGGQYSGGVLFAVYLPEPASLTSLATLTIALLSRRFRGAKHPGQTLCRSPHF